MKRVLLSVSLVLISALPILAQDKEQDRVENAGKVMKEILNAPDSIPQSVLDKADCIVIKYICSSDSYYSPVEAWRGCETTQASKATYLLRLGPSLLR